MGPGLLLKILRDCQISPKEFEALPLIVCECLGPQARIFIMLNELLLHNARDERTKVQVVDMSQDLRWKVLEDIRLLGCLENRAGKLIQIIVAGQPEFGRILDDPTCRQLKLSAASLRKKRFAGLRVSLRSRSPLPQPEPRHCQSVSTRTG